MTPGVLDFSIGEINHQAPPGLGDPAAAVRQDSFKTSRENGHLTLDTTWGNIFRIYFKNRDTTTSLCELHRAVDCAGGW